MPTIKSRYLGDLRTECEHLASGAKLVTDAPTDNQGKGEAFSPTDMVCAALGSCVMTIMGIEARNKGFSIDGATMDIVKTMGANPRRIAKINIAFNMPGDISPENRELLQQAARSCPVCLSLSPDVEQDFIFNWTR